MWIADMCVDRENEDQIFADAHLIANAPEWLRFLLDELERLEREYAEERAAHNAHVTELIEKEEECRKLRKELDLLQELAVKVTVEREKERKSAQQEIERLREERDKLIEGLRWYAEADYDHKIMTDYYEDDGELFYGTDLDLDRGQRARDILKEIGVTDV
jgi:hypothetical protein